MNKKPLTISVLIPSYNEEKSIAACIDSCLNQSRPVDEIIIIDDGSTDTTPEILSSYGAKITNIRLKKNTGNKSIAQEIGLSYVKTDVFIATDADTILDRDFVKFVEEDFNSDSKIVAVAGYIRSLKHNWLTACRELDYVIGQDFHKVAQEYIGSLLVIPGCAGAFKAQVFKEHITFDHDTLTEDLDFTYKFNKKELKIYFDKRAIVHTQDPATIGVYAKQMRRWYAGGWQNLKKHINILERPASALEISMTYIESFMFAFMLFVVPLISFPVFLKMLALVLAYVVSIGLYASIRRRRIDLLLYSPTYLIVALINSYIFLSEFVRELILNKKNLIWYNPERRAN